MTNEEAIANLNMIRIAFGVPVTKEQKELVEETFEMAIQALSQEPKSGWNNHQIACMLADLFGDVCACNYNGIDEWLPELCDFKDTCCPKPIGVACWEQFLKYIKSKYCECEEPCDDTVSIRKDVLKCRVGKLVVYNVEWLKKHWQMEMDIVCGVKQCDDAVSRQAVLGETIRKNSIWNSITNSEGKNLEEIIFELPSVTQKSGKWDRLYSWLNDMRLGIAPDETVDDIDERHCRESQTDILDEIMEWMIKAESEEQTE